MVGFVDAIGLMMVGPSILFYINRFGGTLTHYGWALSSFSLTSLCTKPLLGIWSDRVHTFRQPFVASLFVASLGGWLYLLASAVDGDLYVSTLQDPQDDHSSSYCGASPVTANVESSSSSRTTPSTVALTSIFLGRMLGGIGAANAGLVFAYAAEVAASDELTRANTILSMARMLGMAAGPLCNLLLSNVNITFGSGWKLDPLNSVGIVLAMTNLLSAVVILVWLEEPSDREQGGKDKYNKVATSEEGACDVSDEKMPNDAPDQPAPCSNLLGGVVDPRMTVPVICNLAMCASYHLIATALPPASNHALGWGPVEVSTLLGPTLSAFVVFNMTVVYGLSSLAVRDEIILLFGLTVATVGFVLVYMLWKTSSDPNDDNDHDDTDNHANNELSWHFRVSVLLSLAVNPFLAPTSQSIFSKNIKTSLLLRRYQGTMQSILSMGGSIAGVICPSIVATLCLRGRDFTEVEYFGRELTVWALYPVVLYVLCFVGVSYLVACEERPWSILHHQPAPAAKDNFERNRRNMAKENEQRRQRRLRDEKRIDPFLG